jgi:N-acetylglucosamine-6-phosphate deacetylase
VDRLVFDDALLLDPESGAATRGGLEIADGRIVRQLAEGERLPDARVVELGGRALAPGFLDLHFHGELVFAGPGELDSALRRTAVDQLRHGVTAFLATTMAWSPVRLARHLDAFASFMMQTRVRHGAEILGLHLEGPWINAEAAGAQPVEETRDFDPVEGKELLSRADGLVRMVTMAPELAGADRLMDALARRSVVAAMGHSLANQSEIDAAVESGMTHVTHLFNAMGPLHQRDPGVAGHALADDRLTCDLICDGEHVHPRMVKLAARAKGEGLVLISDRIELPERREAASREGRREGQREGWDEGEITLGSGEVRDDGRALRLADGRLAGSSLTLDRAIRNARSFAAMTRLAAVAACTLRPARVLGIESERGTLRPGARADLVVLDDHDRVDETWLAGRRMYARVEDARAAEPG